VRGEHPEFVFTRAGNPLTGMNNSGWKAARRRAASRYEETLKAPCPNGFRGIPVHDLKHTFGRSLRAACVSFEDRQDLLGHKSARITTQQCVPGIVPQKSRIAATAQLGVTRKCRKNWWKGRNQYRLRKSMKDSTIFAFRQLPYHQFSAQALLSNKLSHLADCREERERVVQTTWVRSPNSKEAAAWGECIRVIHPHEFSDLLA
jgi:hypothetical protein